MSEFMSDEDIAKKCGLKVSDVRSVLNKLHEHGITSYRRERDKDTGWFSYLWGVNVFKIDDMLKSHHRMALQERESRLAYEKAYNFYACPNPGCGKSGNRLPEHTAIITSYICDSCGAQLEFSSNADQIVELEQRSVAVPPRAVIISRIRVAKRPERRAAAAAPRPAVKVRPKSAKAKAKTKSRQGKR
ncbi:MAG: hypothetical protein NT157_04075 [Candidatus Micrarchaeota archaeon]|nr:hypothetical protein [Candidatus Micrarchaeota archaeon]